MSGTRYTFQVLGSGRAENESQNTNDGIDIRQIVLMGFNSAIVVAQAIALFTLE